MDLFGLLMKVLVTLMILAALLWGAVQMMAFVLRKTGAHLSTRFHRYVERWVFIQHDAPDGTRSFTIKVKEPTESP